MVVTVQNGRNNRAFVGFKILEQDTAAAVCDRIVFDLTVAVVKSDNTFFHNIIEGIVIDLDILMVSTQKKCMAANATDDI